MNKGSVWIMVIVLLGLLVSLAVTTFRGVGRNDRWIPRHPQSSYHVTIKDADESEIVSLFNREVHWNPRRHQAGNINILSWDPCATFVFHDDDRQYPFSNSAIKNRITSLWSNFQGMIDVDFLWLHHYLLHFPAKPAALQAHTRFHVAPADNDPHKIHLTTPQPGFYGGIVLTDDSTSDKQLLFAHGAQFVFTGTVENFFGCRIESTSDHPLVFLLEHDRLAYLCGHGQITPPDGQTHTFAPVIISGWIGQLNAIEKPALWAAAQALAHQGVTRHQFELLEPLANADLVTQGLCAETLLHIGNDKVRNDLKNVLEDIDTRFANLPADDPCAACLIKHVDVTVTPFTTLDDITITGTVHTEKIAAPRARLTWLRDVTAAALQTVAPPEQNNKQTCQPRYTPPRL